MFDANSLADDVMGQVYNRPAILAAECQVRRARVWILVLRVIGYTVLVGGVCFFMFLQVHKPHGDQHERNQTRPGPNQHEPGPG